jgi:hypothetical protein
MLQFLCAVQTSLCIDRIARGLQMPVGDAKLLFDNVRVATWLAKSVAERVMPVPPVEADVFRAFNRSAVRFQTARRVGAKRSCSVPELLRDIREVNRYIVADVRSFPKMIFYPLCARVIEQQVAYGEIAQGGISSEMFDSWVRRSFEVVIEEVALDEDGRASFGL